MSEAIVVSDAAGARLASLRAASVDPREADVDVLVVPVFKGGIEGPGTQPVLAALGLDEFPVTAAFRGEAGQTQLLAGTGVAARSVLLVGLGRLDEVDPARLREAAGAAARATPRAATLATTLAEVHATAASVQAVAEGLALGAHADRRWRHGPAADVGAAARGREPTVPAHAVVLVPSSRLADARAALHRGAITAAATAAARELADAPPATKTPAALAGQLTVTAGRDCAAEVWGPADLTDNGCGGILGVGAGAWATPRLLRLRYEPEEPLGRLAMVGQGVTFDSGGLSLEPAEAMPAMKADMAGAAVVAAVCGALPALGVRLAVDAWLPLAENLPGGGAQRPGDVVGHPDGSTTEVVETDAEGRLLLADALALATAAEPDAIVDVATLTGAATRAVGRYAAAAMSTSDDLMATVRAAAETAGERVWPLPLWPELDRFLASGVADQRHVGEGPAGDPGSDVILAGLYLRRFTGDVPWVHLDTPAAWLEPELAGGHLPAGPTGFGVGTLLAWLAPT